MTTHSLVVLVSAAFAASVLLVTGLASPAQADEVPALCYESSDGGVSPIVSMSGEFCEEGPAEACESTCGEDHEDVEITEVCVTFNGKTSCECCCVYEEMS